MTYLKIYCSGLKLCESVPQEGVDLEEHSRSVRRAVNGRLPACPASTRFSFDSLPIFGLFDYFHLSFFLITCHQIDGRREVGASDRRRWDLCIAQCACQLSIVMVNVLVNCNGRCDCQLSVNMFVKVIVNVLVNCHNQSGSLRD